MQTSSRKLLVVLIVLITLGYAIYRSSGMMHLGDFSGAKLWIAIRNADPLLLILSLVAIYSCYALRSLRWKAFQRNLGPSRFGPIYAMTLAGFSAIFLLGRAGEPVRPLLLARKEKLPIADLFGIYALERLFDLGSTAVIAAVGLLLFQSRDHASETAGKLETAARTTGSLLFAGVVGAIAFLLYLRLHGSALLERRLQGWVVAHGWRGKIAGIALGFSRGVQAIRSWSDLALSTFYSAVHWFLVLLVYLWVSHSFGGTLTILSLGDAMLVMAFTLVGSAVQLPGVGGARKSSRGRKPRPARRLSPVKCPFCANVDDKVIDSREGRVGDTIRRRRECLKCGRRFTTYERIDEIPYMVIKKDGRRERFERQKILQGLLKACEKRPVPTPKLEAIVDEIESVVQESTERELTTTEIGEMIMRGLKKLDKVAYVRFASVYMDFKDVQEFMSELKNLLKDRVKK